LPASPARQRLGLPVKQSDDRYSHGAETGNTDAQGRRHGCKARKPEKPLQEDQERRAGSLPDFRGSIKAPSKGHGIEGLRHRLSCLGAGIA
jgi:hypothetical protein